MADKVPSPMWAALNQLNNDVQRELSNVAGALKDADTRMAGGKGDVWCGPTARTWASDLTGAAGDITKQANEFAAYVRQELASQDKEVTQSQADLERRLLSGRMG
ncbi:conserved hypothetical protein [Actinacidiphila cocklensis]|uniref:Uncharacterized protein n=2 Tax=Actinacidiphila cocklensis TaxID=887465 RepID=A0A9W4E9L9_9ACTN|nr:conserved hypothetical protein [Actinacidiphila cocklensis]